MISDPHPVVRQILVGMVARLGYEPVTADLPPTPAQLRSADVLLVEPAAPAGRALARTARAANPTIAIISEGSTPLPEGIDRRGAGATVHLVKPFTIEQLDGALQRAFARRERSRRARAGASDPQPSMTPKSCV